ncbi:hypothetical protein BS329_35815 [Amycolatopsis coloradensis]|uniref:Orc1-like AAA ATPase domain-containing protein n=1 Tax=Amycolatopsis coloradensis TaxID=76021 RepID=A0A1R0KGH1_9PSEU|nr:AAA family ATPase [Amycolatopsis coloradensis]OLZ44677.1 hypothetical protein BS329_35815 [Amycolatopsis coloradensis]
MSDRPPRRILIATGTTRHPHCPDLGDRPELSGEIDRMVRLFTAPESGLGYRQASGFTADMRFADLRAGIREVVTSKAMTSEDHVVFYYTGHGQVDDSGEFLFPLVDTTEDLVGTGLLAGDLARWLWVGSRVQRLLIVLDTCHAGKAGAEISRFGTAALGRLRGLANQPGFEILTATRPSEEALAGTFTQALERAIRHRGSGGHDVPFLKLDTVVSMINSDPEKAPSQHAQRLGAGESESKFLPNPRFNTWLRGLDLRTQFDHERRQERDRDLKDHVLPRAQGLDRPQADKWLFTGRHEALKDLCDWLRDLDRDGRSRVVHGAPGSGKSALLSRLTVLAHPQHRQKVPRLDQLPPETIPPRRGIDTFIHARGQTSAQVLAKLCQDAEIEATTPGDLLAELADRQRPFVAVIDALDEATDADELVMRVLSPLLRGAPRSRLRLLLGTRTPLLGKLGGPFEALDLDSERYADPESVTTYVKRCLLDLVPDSPYSAAPPHVLDAVATAVGTAAGQSFLVALITGRSLALRKDIPNPYSDRWRAALPRYAAEAMRLDLDGRLGAEAAKARDLLAPLAYARGSGLPWEDVWAAQATVLAGRSYTMADIDWLVEKAGFYVIEAEEKERSVYRLYHEALAEHLREDRGERASHQAIFEFWIDRATTANGKVDWWRAHTYALRHLATHAEKAGTLENLLADPVYLLNAERAPLLTALAADDDTMRSPAAQAYSRTLKHLWNKPVGEHASYLELAAHCHRATILAKNIAAEWPEPPWRTLWAQWVRRSRNLTVKAHQARVTSIAVGDPYGHPVVVSGSEDGTIKMWDLATGVPDKRAIETNRGAVHAVVLGELESKPILVSGGDDMQVHLWDYVSGMPIGAPLTGHIHQIRAMAFAEVDGVPTLVTGSFDRTVRAWDLSTGQAKACFEGHKDSITAVKISTRLRPLAISGALDGWIRVWDLLSGQAGSRKWNRGKSSVVAMDTVETAERLIVVTSSSDGSIGAFDLMTGEVVGRIIDSRSNPARAVAARYLDGRLIVVCGHTDRKIRTWDLNTGSEFAHSFAGHESSIHAVGFGGLDGQPLAISGGDDRTVRVHDLAVHNGDKSFESSHLRGLRCIAIARVRNRVVVVSGSDDATIRLWDAETGKPLGEPLEGHSAEVRAIAVGSVAGTAILLSGSEDGVIRIWDLETGEARRRQLNHGHPVRAVACTIADKQLVAVSGGSDGSVDAWNLETGARMTSPLVGYLYPILAVSVGRATGRVERLPIGSESEHGVLWGPVRGSFTEAKPESAVAVFARADGRNVLAAGGQDGVFRLWTLGNGKTSMFGLRVSTGLSLLEERSGKESITAIAYHARRGFAIARTYFVEIEDLDGKPRTVYLDAEIKALAFAAADKLIVGTNQGILALRI